MFFLLVTGEGQKIAKSASISFTSSKLTIFLILWTFFHGTYISLTITKHEYSFLPQKVNNLSKFRFCKIERHFLIVYKKNIFEIGK